jgi:hypothetical protein
MLRPDDKTLAAVHLRKLGACIPGNPTRLVSNAVKRKSVWSVRVVFLSTHSQTHYTHIHTYTFTPTRRSVGSHGGNAGGSLPDQGRPEAPYALPPRQHGVWPGEEKEVCVCTCEKERAKLPAPTCVRALVCMCVDIRNT